MSLTSTHHRPYINVADERDRLAFTLCEEAKELEEAGKYEEAAGKLGGFWHGVGTKPFLEGLGQTAQAELLLRVGSLTGFLGSLNQVAGAQESAKDLISASASIFEEAGDASKAAEARVSLAICYWREGALDEARAVLRDVLTRIAGQDAEQEARALLGLVLVERRATRYDDALRILLEAAPLFEAIPSHAHKGRFYNQLATVLENLGRTERRADYIDRALLEYAAASFHFEQAGHTGFCASVENNLGFLFSTINENEKAYKHLQRALRLFEQLGDCGRTAQVEDTLARVLLAEGKLDEAAQVSRSALRRLEDGGEQSLLVEALLTCGRICARSQNFDEAEASLRRAIELAESCGDLEGAGQSAIILLEEMSFRMSAEEQRALYVRADELLSRSQDASLLLRLRSCARRLITATQSHDERPAHPNVISSAPQFVHAAFETAEILRRARLVAHAEGAVLLSGETGTGKEALARMIHHWSGRSGKFRTFHCAGVSDPAFNIRLFSSMPLDRTDVQERPSALEESAGGTLYFDEVGALSPATQATLLRLLELIDSARHNSNNTFDVRVLASTNVKLETLVAEGRFRGDLFYRLQNFSFHIPPLRERPADIPALAKHFIERANKRSRKNVSFTLPAIEAMSLLPLRGNARELESLIERTILTASNDATITAESIEIASLRGDEIESLGDPWAGFSLKDEVHRVERRFIELALREAQGKVSHAARILGFSHHESLASLLKNRHRVLLSARTPARARRRSIIKKHRP